METIKDKTEKVMKAIKGNFISLETKKGDEITLLNVVDDDGTVVKSFSKTDYGPRFWIKATQYASNNSTLEQRLTVKELA